MGIRIKHGEFVDEHNRVLNLRGINVGGSSKVPSTNSNNNHNNSNNNNNNNENDHSTQSSI
eukprot:CAMPEP_0196141164 /NCGR_PEP_ID=MMETSP0910-20130528/8878_1 /TAXON_ID=49265 /ORGANISM="Thalassiosira rotula, Strain GSO102" /LENGTH=60 /DNA_ID=CAMNT_0041402235 /DNA_START=120 /DNA_END=299 /DNA_ORIENTATION=+